ncbi:chloramphenicol resistance protein [Clostridium gasigenes]|uniref:chloramphenicol resistance protein n=1 Tax=Clostridium gasigenes TaxID=94869 RepID=UPI001C0AFF4E|nr:chloramphenicol resistance protein [Clostridium gasigenes]MBU3109343.1 chloramphenicol resistance protein [Clostridium gasigenes]
MIINNLRNFIKTCPHLDKFAKGINVDYLDEYSTSYYIEEVPCNPIINKYIDESSIRQYIFIFTSREAYETDILENIDKCGFYEEFSNWLKKQNLLNNLPILEGNKKSLKIEATKTSYAFEPDVDKAKYQIQGRLIYFEGGI